MKWYCSFLNCRFLKVCSSILHVLVCCHYKDSNKAATTRKQDGKKRAATWWQHGTSVLSSHNRYLSDCVSSNNSTAWTQCKLSCNQILYWFGHFTVGTRGRWTKNPSSCKENRTTMMLQFDQIHNCNVEKLQRSNYCSALLSLPFLFY